MVFTYNFLKCIKWFTFIARYNNNNFIIIIFFNIFNWNDNIVFDC